MSNEHHLTLFPAGARRVLSAIALAAASLLVGSAAMACPDWQQTGQQIRYSADQLWSPQTLSVIAGGGDNLRNCPQPGVGYVATRPDFDFAFTDNSAARDLDFRVNGGCDTVLLINDARGQWHFNDDGGDGLNARLRIPNAPTGGYDIWVGTYGPSTCQATLTLETFGGGSVSQPQPQPQPGGSCPDWQQTGQQIRYSADQLWSPQTLSVIAGGSANLRNCSQPGVGYVATRPDFDFAFTDNSAGRDLDFRVESSCDTVLLVNDARGQWHFNDDGGNGLNARLRIPNAPTGGYDIWVGTYGPSTCQATLTLETFPGGSVSQPQPQPQPGGACPDWQQTGQQIRYSADQLWSPQTLSVIAGGGANLRNCTQPGVGYVATRPDFDFAFTDNSAGRDLEFRVTGGCDTVLLVNDARAQWHFNDDGGDGLNARLRIPNAPAGSYDIWVGTYGPSTCQAALTIETFGGMQLGK